MAVTFSKIQQDVQVTGVRRKFSQQDLCIYNSEVITTRLFFISQYINTTGARICFKELYESKYDPLYIQYMVLSGEVDRFPLSSRGFLKILTFQKVLKIAHAGTGAVDPTL